MMLKVHQPNPEKNEVWGDTTNMHAQPFNKVRDMAPKLLTVPYNVCGNREGPGVTVLMHIEKALA